MGELLGEVVDVLRREGLARDGSLCLFDGVDCTSIPQFSNTLSRPLDKAVIDVVSWLYEEEIRMKPFNIVLGVIARRILAAAAIGSLLQLRLRHASLIIRSCVTLIIFIGNSIIVFGQLNSPIWVARYDGGFIDEAYDIAVSPDSRTVYVTGFTERLLDGMCCQSDYVTIAYDAATGREIWRAFYVGPYDDRAVSVVVSPDGCCVYVAGYSSNGDNYDYLIIAYDAQTGMAMWLHRYDADGWDDKPFDMTISPNGEIVYVTGVAGVTLERDDYATIAIRAVDGELLWADLYDGPYPVSGDTGLSIVINPDGSRVFVAGQLIGIGEVSDPPPTYQAVIAYDALNGNRLWISVYDTPDSVNGLPSDISIRHSGDLVYVTGAGLRNPYTADNHDISTVCYRADTGEHVWVKRYEHIPPQSQDIGFSVAAGQNLVFATGMGEVERVTIAYEATTGDIVWTSTLCRGVGYAITLNRDESKVFVTGMGSFLGNTFEDFATAAYDSTTGKQLWADFYGVSDSGVEYARSIALSSDENLLFVAGESSGDFTVVAYHAAPPIVDGDANSDGCVDDADLLLILFNFGQSCCGSPFDLNDDCSVDDADLLMVLFNFGQGC